LTKHNNSTRAPFGNLVLLRILGTIIAHFCSFFIL